MSQLLLFAITTSTIQLLKSQSTTKTKDLSLARLSVAFVSSVEEERGAEHKAIKQSTLPTTLNLLFGDDLSYSLYEFSKDRTKDTKRRLDREPTAKNQQ